jgi:hypothetical protein
MGTVKLPESREVRTLKRDPREVKEFITGRGIGYPASRDDLIKFADGKQVNRDVLDLLRGMSEIEYNTPDDVTREIESLENERIRPPKPKED